MSTTRCSTDEHFASSRSLISEVARVGLEANFRLSGRCVGQALDRLAAQREWPNVIIVDNGMEFTSKALVEWAAPWRQARSHAAGQASMKSNHSFHVVASCGILTFWHRRKCDQQIHNYTGAGQVAVTCSP